MAGKGTVVITEEEYEMLREDGEFLACLEAAGVDNWDGYGEAIAMYREEEDE
ncbi:hypothetical protein [Salibacterium lacus]|uniref:Uncharacterized protein n=1 Tax=Salibacterium lacus TaxID=1898109 RepID=A0ABW5T006_9BACI